VGNERLGPSYFFISLVLGPLNCHKHPLMVRTFLKVYMELGSYFLLLHEQIKGIIIIKVILMKMPWLRCLWILPQNSRRATRW
jgi:hypothetical protein